VVIIQQHWKNINGFINIFPIILIVSIKIKKKF
jgi:hypothetical protein